MCGALVRIEFSRKIQRTMKHIITILLFSLLLPVQTLRAHEALPAAYDAMVVVSIEGLDDAALSRLTTEIGKAKNASLEYSCTWSGVVVIKYDEISVGERADVITMVRRLLSAAGIERGVEVVHVHVEARGVGKC
jgi:hypothetical protein